jgi:hypothetical protein
MNRALALGGSLLLVLLLAGLTINVIVTSGVDVLVVVSLVIVAMFGFGVVGAILNPPDR